MHGKESTYYKVSVGTSLILEAMSQAPAQSKPKTFKSFSAKWNNRFPATSVVSNSVQSTESRGAQLIVITASRLISTYYIKNNRIQILWLPGSG